MIGQDMKIKKTIDDLNKGTRNWQVVIWLLSLAGMLSIAGYGVERYAEFRKTWGWQKPVVINFEAYTRPILYRLPEPQILSPIVIETIEEEPIEAGTPVEKKILELWGERYFLLARSVFKCESGLRADAINWGSKDIGVAQVNFPTWEKSIKEKFGYTLVDLFDPIKNLEVAYWIWDRADGVEDDGKGSFQAWVVFQNNNFVSCVE